LYNKLAVGAPTSTGATSKLSTGTCNNCAKVKRAISKAFS